MGTHVNLDDKSLIKSRNLYMQALDAPKHLTDHVRPVQACAEELQELLSKKMLCVLITTDYLFGQRTRLPSQGKVNKLK